MFSKNLKYYRLKKNISKKDLASLCSVSSMAITNYENGTRRPSMDVLKCMANALDVKVSDFLAVRNQNLVFCHGEFRKNKSLGKQQQELIRESVEEYFSRFYTSIEILGGEVLPQSPPCHALQLDSDPEQCAVLLRKHLNISTEGPIGDLIELLENKGILVLGLDIGNSDFSGMNGFVNDRPYIVYNKTMTTERNRSTIAHELAHLMFVWPENLADDEEEKLATAISGAFLFPKNDVVRELGLRRRAITGDMVLVCKEYGISMFMLAKRAEVSKVITKDAAQNFYIAAGQKGWRKNEPTRITSEQPMLFTQLVYRAINENEISVQRGAELLQIPFAEVAKHSYICEV